MYTDWIGGKGGFVSYLIITGWRRVLKMVRAICNMLRQKVACALPGLNKVQHSVVFNVVIAYLSVTYTYLSYKVRVIFVFHRFSAVNHQNTQQHDQMFVFFASS